MDITRRSVAQALIFSVGLLLLTPAEAQRAGCFPTYSPRVTAQRPILWAPSAFDGLFTISYGRLLFDIDEDGAAEIITDDPYRGLYSVIAFEPESRSYRIRSSPPQLLSNTFSVSPSFVGTLDGSGRPKLLSGSGGNLNVVDLRTAKLETTTQLGAIVDRAQVLDVDRDGQIDIVGSGLTLMNTELTRIKAFSREMGLGAFVAGNFDADPNIELAGQSGLIYEYANGAFRLEAAFAANSVYPVYVGATDTNGDGILELVYVADGFLVRAYSLQTHATVWETRSTTSLSDHQVQALHVVDVNDDGISDVLIMQVGAPGNPGEVQALDGRNGAIMWRIPHPDVVPLELQVADVDGDGERELVFGVERPVSGPDTMYIYDLKTRSLEWSSLQEVGGVEALDIADADGDGETEFLWAPKFLRTRPDGQIHWRKAANLRYDADGLRVSSPALIETGIQSLLVANVIGDTQPELLVGTDADTSGRVYIYSLPGRTLVRTLQTEQGTSISALAVGDVTGDDVPEILAGVSSTTTASDGAQIVAFNPVTGERVWSSPVLSLIFGEINGMRVVDLDGDGRIETIATIGSSAGGVSVVDGAGPALRVSGEAYFGLEVMQVAGDTRPEIIAGTGAGLLRILSSSNLAVLAEWQACDGPIRAVARNPFTAASAHQVLFTCGMQLKSADLNSGTIATVSTPIALDIGLRNRLIAFQETGGAPTLALSARNGVHLLHTTTNLPSFVRPGDSCMGVAFSTHWREPLIGQLQYGDHEGDALTLTVTALPSIGNLTLGRNGEPSQFLFEGAPFKGPDLFAIKANDGELDSPVAIVGLNLENEAPILPVSMSLTVAPGARAFNGFAARDFDDDPLTFEVLQAPTKGVLTLSTGDNFFYDAAANAQGTDTFIVRAFDQVEYSEPLTYTITIAVAPPPPPPPPPSSGGNGGKSGGGGRMDGTLLLLLSVLALRPRRRRRSCDRSGN